MGEFLMPSLGADMEAGTLAEWLRKPGEQLRRGDIIAVVETHKGAIEIEIFQDGILEKTLVSPGEKVPVGTPLAIIRSADEPASAPKPARPADETRQAPPTNEMPAVAPAPALTASLDEDKPESPPPRDQKAADRVKITPVARRRAAQAGLDPDTLDIRGTGPSGSIVLDDIERRIEAGTPEPSPSPAPEKPAIMDGMRLAIAAAMSKSKREIPHYYLANSVDLTEAEAFLARTNAEREPAERVLMGALYIKAVANSLNRFPEFNGFFTDGQYRPCAAIHVGMAINIRGGGLVAPAVHDAATADLDAVMAVMRDLVARVRAGRFRSSELTDPTITISSLGDRGVETLYGVIYPPQVAIVGFGAVAERPWSIGGKVVSRRVVNITLAADHRASDGHRGALFLQAIGNALQKPEDLK